MTRYLIAKTAAMSHRESSRSAVIVACLKESLTRLVPPHCTRIAIGLHRALHKSLQSRLPTTRSGAVW